MIQANELRIGNYGLSGGQELMITAQGILYLQNGEMEFEPIPLTEEWLLKFGFEKYDEIYWFLPNYPSYEICPNEPLQLFLPCETTDESEFYVVKDSNCKIQYVHQLQNLYFAFTGEELTIKE